MADIESMADLPPELPFDQFLDSPCPTQIRLRTDADVIAMVPYLLGFHPQESLVVIVVDAGLVAVTLRLDLRDCEYAQWLSHVLGRVLEPHPQGACLLVAYSVNRHAGERVARLVESAVGEHEILQRLIVSEGRYWVMSKEPGDQGPSPGRLVPRKSCQVATEAVVAGMSAFANREQMAALVAGPHGYSLAEANQRVACQLASLPTQYEDRLTRLDVLIEMGLSGQLNDDELTELGLLIGERALKDRAALGMTRGRASEQVALWLAVVARLPPQVCVPALGMAGLAAWLSGNGALQVNALVRGIELCPTDRMLRLLEQINQLAASPRLWDEFCRPTMPMGADGC